MMYKIIKIEEVKDKLGEIESKSEAALFDKFMTQNAETEWIFKFLYLKFVIISTILNCWDF